MRGADVASGVRPAVEYGRGSERPGRLGALRRAALAAVVAVVPVAAVVALPAVEASAAPTNTLTVQVVSARTEPRAFAGAGVSQGDPVSSFKFLINQDNTGATNVRSATGVCSPSYDPPPGEPGYPRSCPWTSINADPDAAPIVAQGDQDTLATGLDLPDGKYLISVLADGYKLDGAHFTMPLPSDNPVMIEVQPMPLPDSTVKGQVFEDMAPTNGAYDAGDQPLQGFVGHLNDVLGEISTDVYGNPLCTTYVGEDPVTHEIPLGDLDADMLPVVDKVGGECISDADGVVTFPHMGTNRYTQYVTPPDGQQWIQTTTLEGNHDWDSWVMEGSTGYDTEFVHAGEQVPTPLFGFASPLHNGQPISGTAGGHVTGRVMRTLHYVPPKGGVFDIFNGFTGSKIQRPIKDAWLSLADLGNGDQAVWVGQAGSDGRFDISGVPDGDYTLTWWDEAQNNLLALQNVTVRGGETVAMGTLPVSGWWTEMSGYIFNDKNRNGVREAGENGIPNFTLTLRKRDNSLMDRGQTTATTDANGYYSLEGAYPLGEFGWTVLEAYSDSFYTTGITYQADNAPSPTTVKGSGVDVSTLNIIGLGGTMDWGVHAYDAPGTSGIDPRNGGIVGSISYDTTRNELDPQYAAAEDWQPGVPDIPVKLYATVDCGTHADAPCDADGLYELAADGSYRKGALLNSYLSEGWDRPTGCTAYDVDGVPLVHGVDEDHLARNQETNGICIPAFSQSFQFGPYATDQGTPDAGFGATVNGNYGFGDGCFNGTLDDSDPANPVCTGGQFTALGAGDYLVSLDIPDDRTGNPMYKVTGEEDINIGNGNQIVPQVPPPSCAGALHTVDLAGDGTDSYPALVGDGTNGAPNGVTVPASTPVDNATFLDLGGSPYEGMPKRTCGTKLVELNNGKSVVPMFNVFTDVPLPSRLRGLIIDDVNFSADPKTTAYGEKAPAPFVPVGIYDFTNRLVTTVESDYNGFWDVLLPSTNHISCPTPSGVCAGMYRFVGNDSGVPGALNPNYNPRYRTISTEFEALPGVTIPTDLAVTQVGMQLSAPGTGQLKAVTCPVGAATPQLFAVSRPYVNGSGAFTIEGTGFGATQGTGTVTLGSTVLPVTGWNDTTIQASVPAGTPAGAAQLVITNNGGRSTVNGLTFHVLGTGYSPTVREVGPGKQYATIQSALDASLAASADDLVVVYPGAPDTTNPRNNPLGAYYENLIMASPVKLQGVGPGGFQGDFFVPGSILDAGAFGGDTQLATDWYTTLGGLTWDGNQAVSDGAGVTVLASQNATTAAGAARQFTSGYRAAIDGFDLRGGDQQGFPGNINQLTGAPTGLPPNITTQGGAVFANAYARYLQITNNVVENNGGAYGTIRVGTPDLPAPDTSQHNENVRISHNRIVNNGGTNLAGGLGLFAGSDAYEVDHNDICGNFSVEYGGGMTVYGRSPGGQIHHNRIYLNMSFDEGGGIMIAGQLPANPDSLSPGSGPVDIYANEIKANLANDDGGGVRFLMAGGAGGTDQMNVVNNVISGNVSTHEGGGISLNDAPTVRVVNNTIMKNLTTATAVTSNGQPAPAGLSSSANSTQLQATLPGSAPTFSDPVLFNNIFWDNRAGARAGTTVLGIGLPGDSTPVDNWDLGMFDTPGLLSPTSSIVQQDAGTHAYNTAPSNSNAAPQVVAAYDVSVSFATWRQNPAFVDATLVAVDAPPDQLGDYHLSGCPASPACNLGATAKGAVNAPTTDLDDQLRPALGGIDAGADEFGASLPVPKDFYFSTTGSTNPPGVAGTADDADIYRYDGAAFARAWDASVAGVAGAANVDGLERVDAGHFYLSFAANTTLPGLGAVADEDVVYYDNGTWRMFFDGSANGLAATTNVVAFSIVGQTLYLSLNNAFLPPGSGGAAGLGDVYRWNGGSSYARVVDASTVGMPNAAIDGLIIDTPSHFWASWSTDQTAPITLQDEDVVEYNAGTWSTWFDGTAAGLTAAAADLDAISLPTGADPMPAPPPPADQLFYSTAGNVNPPGAGGTADDADLYGWTGTDHVRVFDASLAGLPNGANIDGLDRVDATHFYVSFDGNVAVPGIATTVQDEDVVYNNNGTWSVWFDGTAQGLTAAGEDIDALSVVGGSLYFSTVGSVNPPGVAGTADDADVYLWDGTAFSRAFDASANGIPGYANVDGVVWTDATHLYVSFADASVTLPGIGTVQDEDVVRDNGGTWSVYFDGTSHGLGTAAGLDVDAFDLP
ncbi:MAG TPA: SdrD B-like domain-containing protein [Nocardioides sp.]|uniref:SdrD B-like domain-containing protein n=1 Tax=Nocardioides sp. TaxID=35761 RepID=UPI002BF327B0|nr:SdrD B-like domain-containing protein [Nocardioides sp.]HQR26823.1 SdrD B-like domain-containing protein [Nocardioides sp.]